MARVSIEDLEIAAAWCEVNEGPNGEAEACKRVAAMLDGMIRDRRLKAVAREAGVSLGKVKETLRKRQS